MTDLVRRLRDGNLTVSGAAKDINALLKLHREAADEITRLRMGIFHIMAAARDGKVCDDVAWFDDVTTLWDHCAWLVYWDGEPDVPLPVDAPRTDKSRETTDDLPRVEPSKQQKKATSTRPPNLPDGAYKAKLQG